MHHDDRLASPLVEVMQAESSAVEGASLKGIVRPLHEELPLQPEHEAIQPAADAQETDAVAWPQKVAFFG